MPSASPTVVMDTESFFSRRWYTKDCTTSSPAQISQSIYDSKYLVYDVSVISIRLPV